MFLFCFVFLIFRFFLPYVECLVTEETEYKLLKSEQLTRLQEKSLPSSLHDKITSRGHSTCFSPAGRIKSTFASRLLLMEQERSSCRFHSILNRTKMQVGIQVFELNGRVLAQYLSQEVFTQLKLEYFPPPLRFPISCL